MAHKLTIPIFEGSDYSLWKVKMRGYLTSLSFNTWKSMKNKYVQLANDLTTSDAIQVYEENEKARQVIVSVLSKNELTKVISLNTAYEVQEELRDVYEGNTRVKLSKKLTAKCRYENLKMEEGEYITSYFQKVDSIVNKIRELGGTLTDEDIIEKILMSLPKIYSDKISAIEETYDLKKFTKEKLYGTLSAFEMRKFGKDKDKYESTFKASKEDPKDESSNEMEANFVRKLKKGIDKYKGMLPLKCFRCGKIGHIAT